MQAELLTTAGCHLCDQALEVIRRAAPALELTLVDIAEDDALIEQYGEKIPVVRLAGRELCWPFGLLDVRTLVDGQR